MIIEPLGDPHDITFLCTLLAFGAVAEFEPKLILDRVLPRHAARTASGPAHRKESAGARNAAIRQDRDRGQSFRQIAEGCRISTATVQRVLQMTSASAPVTELLEKSA